MNVLFLLKLKKYICMYALKLTLPSLITILEEDNSQRVGKNVKYKDNYL